MKKLGLFILMISTVAASAQSIVTDRPSQSNSSTVIPKSSFQVEAGASAIFTTSGATSASQLIAPTTLLRYGVSNYFEFRAQTQFESYKAPLDLTRTSGVADFQVGIKIRFLDNDEDQTKIAWVSHLSVPTGSRGVSSGEYSTINSLAVSHVLADNISLFYNAGYNVFLDRYGDATYSIGASLGVTDKLNFFVESYGQYIQLKTYQASFDGGLSYLLKDNVQLDFSYGAGLNHKMNFLSLGFSWNTIRGTANSQEETVNP